MIEIIYLNLIRDFDYAWFTVIENGEFHCNEIDDLQFSAT